MSQIAEAARPLVVVRIDHQHEDAVKRSQEADENWL